MDPKNFCNITSMAWGCGCLNKAPSYPVYLWPIVDTECSDKLQACQSECLTMSSTQMAPCQSACNAYFQCGSANAPPSYLETNQSTDIPLYVAPAAASSAAATATGANGKVSAAMRNAAEQLGSIVLAIAVVAGVAML